LPREVLIDFSSNEKWQAYRGSGGKSVLEALRENIMPPESVLNAADRAAWAEEKKKILKEFGGHSK